MRIRVVFPAVLLLAAACASQAPSATGARPATATATIAGAAKVRHKAPVVLILMENHRYDEIVGVPDAAYMNAFAQAGALLTNMYAVDHPSLPNYLALMAGSTLGCPDDSCPTRHYTSNNLFHQLQHTGRSWRSWEESMVGNCSVHNGSGYAVRHNPAPYFTDLYPTGCPQWDVPYPSKLPKKLRDFTFITPNTCNDIHSCPIATGDAWLHAHVPPLLKRGAIVIIDFDEDHNPNHVYCAIRGPGIRPGTRRTAAYTHYGLLAGLEDYFGLPRLHEARTARAVRI